MREIEFRAFVKDKEKIFDVKTIDFSYRFITFEEENKPTDTMRMLDQVELMQYTGLKDNSGTKIFEGDIVSFDEKEWGSKYIEVVKWDYSLLDLRKNDYKQWCEVIGNIYVDRLGRKMFFDRSNKLRPSKARDIFWGCE